MTTFVDTLTNTVPTLTLGSGVAFTVAFLVVAGLAFVRARGLAS